MFVANPVGCCQLIRNSFHDVVLASDLTSCILDKAFFICKKVFRLIPHSFFPPKVFYFKYLTFHMQQFEINLVDKNVLNVLNVFDVIQSLHPPCLLTLLTRGNSFIIILLLIKFTIMLLLEFY